MSHNNPWNRTDPFGLDDDWDQQVWRAQQDLIEAAAPYIEFGIGFGDTATFGAAKIVRGWEGIDDPNLECSVEYQAGGWTAFAVMTAIDGAGLYESFAGLGIRRSIKAAGEEGFDTFSAFKKAYGRAGDNMDGHHIVPQHADNIAKFGGRQLHNELNVVRVPRDIHIDISAYYSSKRPFTGAQTVRDWLKPQSFEEQYDFGVQLLRNHGWTP